jgi:hypothetical protein
MTNNCDQNRLLQEVDARSHVGQSPLRGHQQQSHEAVGNKSEAEDVM